MLKNIKNIHFLTVALLLTLLSSTSFAQTNGTFKQLRLVNVADSTQALPINGNIFHNEQRGVIQAYFNNSWHDWGSTFPLSNVVFKAGSTTTFPMGFQSGPLLTSKSVGKWGFLTDKLYFTITTGTAEKEITLNDAALTSGRIPYVTTNGRLVDNNNLQWDNGNADLLINPGGALGNIGIGVSSPTGALHIRAGSSLAVSAPIKFTLNGGIMTNPEVGAFEAALDNLYFTITTGTARKQLTLNDNALTANRLTYTTTNGRLTDLSTGADGTFLRASSGLPTYSTVTLPNTISARSIWLANSANTMAELTPAAGQSIRMNAGNTAWEAYTPGGGGITNTAANTELMKSDGTNAIPSGVFIPSNGSVTMGSGSISGSRTLKLESSSTNASLVLQTKANGILQVVSSNAPTLGIVLDPNASTLYNASAATFNILGTTSGTNGQDLNIEGGTGTGGIGGRLILRGGLSGVSESNYGNINISSPIVEIGVFNHVASTSTIVRGVGGNNSAVNGIDLTFQGGAAYTVSGNGNGGDITIKSGLRRPAGSGTDGDVVIDPLTGDIIMTISRTSCAGAPTNSLANVAGVLTICP